MPRFRTGTKVPLNVYDGDRPVFQAHSIESAAELVRLLNRGHLAEQVSRMHVDPDVPRSVPFDTFPADSLTPPETPVERPESPSEPPPATGQPADDGGPQSGRWTLDGTTIWWEFGAGEAMEPEQALRNHVDNPQFEPAYDALAALINGDW